MFDLRDLYALPIAFSLTLWDAIPIYLSVSLALAILVRTILRGQALHMAWRLREIIAIEGLLYLAMFRPSLVPVLLISSVVATMLHLRSAWHDAVPITQGDALKTRLGELFPALLISCLAAAIMKVFAPGVPDHLAHPGERLDRRRNDSYYSEPPPGYGVTAGSEVCLAR